jgi:hypothetical protein
MWLFSGGAFGLDTYTSITASSSETHRFSSHGLSSGLWKREEKNCISITCTLLNIFYVMSFSKAIVGGVGQP